MARMGAPVGTPGKGPLEPAMSTWEYGRGVSESTPCWDRNKNHVQQRNFLFCCTCFVKKLWAPCPAQRSWWGTPQGSGVLGVWLRRAGCCTAGCLHTQTCPCGTRSPPFGFWTPQTRHPEPLQLHRRGQNSSQLMTKNTLVLLGQEMRQDAKQLLQIHLFWQTLLSFSFC